ncbi:hypothetical protein AUEXF2481DRAFT_462547 [Aureobasidium subglaciale EXF-2481]|uniref:Uncharacterized protein n=1 Tax=Aureobasidium subglaciale (strain EXF-2481) TaxID=1043005 RepID=A0A074YXN3_AURSE|nr:uncharacterized protein AUEXF2481DRAFT_462547 [Aureobasidium subglaciale EXF-2481]KEQ91591.1 hypothetical protein AUEXF2481DRAFT_462547 [Aureobasidium subglaciale EXF-2481]
MISSTPSLSRSKLERMNVHTSGGGVFTTQTSLHGFTAVVVKELSRSWVLERLKRDDHRDGIIAHEASQIQAGTSTSDTNPFRSRVPQNPEKEVFPRIWPYEEETEWREGWYSFPLMSD